jgi:glycosyltransferase involved in cell wall biosynthesis
MPSWSIENSGLSDMNAPMFSIIVPTFNSAKEITGCVESIIHQSLDNWELLIMDGLSTDDTLSILSKYAAVYPVKIISQKDNGIYDAMNKGLSVANGSWIYFLGSDDRLYNNDVLSVVAHTIIEEPDIKVVYGDVWSDRFNGRYGHPFTASELLINNISHQAIFFHKSVFAKTGYFNEKYKAHADWDHNLKWIFCKDISRKYIHEVIAYYADGGFSSIHGDPAFNKDKRSNFLMYSKNQLKQGVRIKVLFVEAIKSLIRFDTARLRRAFRSF